ncbi:MAG TPA: cytochrome C oxidase subunit II, partial [Spirochaetia bacterium]|nr:cytochrome C oxidase subunit II [Spirochaetia bacterium]
IEIQHLWDVLEMVYEDSKFLKGIVDFNDLAKRVKNKIRRKIKSVTGDPLYEDIEKSWDEISFIRPAETQIETMNRTYLFEKDKIKRRIVLMKDKLQNIYSYRYPIKRRVVEERMSKLEFEFNLFDYMINPYHIQPGLLLDVDITSIKRKKATLDGMANVLNEFLHGVSKGFQDAAFAAFSRRRSTVRDDIAQSFATTGAEPGEEKTEYLDMLTAAEPARPKAPSRGRPARSRGVVDSSKRGRGRRKSRGGGLKEI